MTFHRSQEEDLFGQRTRVTEYEDPSLKPAGYVFPSVVSYLRLTICYLVEYSRYWASERVYFREDKVLGSLDVLYELMTQVVN